MTVRCRTSQLVTIHRAAEWAEVSNGTIRRWMRDEGLTPVACRVGTRELLFPLARVLQTQGRVRLRSLWRDRRHAVRTLDP
jgi:hypothetical protein